VKKVIRRARPSLKLICRDKFLPLPVNFPLKVCGEAFKGWRAAAFDGIKMACGRRRQREKSEGVTAVYEQRHIFQLQSNKELIFGWRSRRSGEWQCIMAREERRQLNHHA